MKFLGNPFITYVIGVCFGSLFTSLTVMYLHKSSPEINIVKECYKQTTDSKTMLHRIKCEVE